MFANKISLIAENIEKCSPEVINAVYDLVFPVQNVVVQTTVVTEAAILPVTEITVVTEASSFIAPGVEVADSSSLDLTPGVVDEIK